jgi:hypothetical protein
LAIPPAYGDSTYDQQQKDKRDRMMGSLLDLASEIRCYFEAC